MERLIEEYLDELSKVRDSKTVQKKRYLLRHFEELGVLEDLRGRELTLLHEKLRERGLSDRTIKDVFREVKLFYEWLWERGFSVEFDEKALRRVLSYRREEGTKRKYYTDEEVRLILDAISGRLEGFQAKPPVYYLLVVLLVSSGLRLSEALALKKEDFERRKVVTEEGEEKELWFVRVRKGKFGKGRIAPLVFFYSSPKLVEEKLKRLRPGEPFFTYSVRYPKSVKTFVLKPSTAKWFFWSLERELKEKGYDLEVNAHRFRKTYATKLATMGFPVNLVADWLGHSKLSTTLDVYVDAEREKALSLLAQKV